MQVGDVLKKKTHREVFAIRPEATVREAVRRLTEHHIGGLPVVTADGRLVGFVSEREVIRTFDERWERTDSLTVDDIMERPAPVCEMSDALVDVMVRMTRKRFRHLVVVDGDAIEGILSIGDLVKQRMLELETEAGVLRDVVAGQRAR